MNNLDFADAVTQDVRGAVQYLKRKSPKVSIIGFCMGGALTIFAAAQVKEVDAAVCWYAMPPHEAVDLARIAIPLQGHFAEHDEFFPTDQVRKAEGKLKDAGINHEFYWYDAQHAFGNETLKPDNPHTKKLADHYNPEAAKLAWQRTFDFLRKHVKA
jgi:carboxymethylenebutenolidase